MTKTAFPFQPPQQLLVEAKGALAAVDSVRLFNNSAYVKTREKWCAAMFGLGYEEFVAPCRVAVNESRQRPDADLYLETGGLAFPFQLVEAMEPERRRGAEYKAMAKTGTGNLRGLGNDAERGHVEGSDWIANAIALKAAKCYAGAEGLNLLVYMNFNAVQLQYADVVRAATAHLPAFASVWVVSNLWLCSLKGSNALGKVEGWGEIFTPEQYLANEAG